MHLRLDKIPTSLTWKRGLLEPISCHDASPILLASSKAATKITSNVDPSIIYLTQDSAHLKGATGEFVAASVSSLKRGVIVVSGMSRSRGRSSLVFAGHCLPSLPALLLTTFPE